MATATDSRAEYVIARHNNLKNDRSTFDTHWSEVAERVLPRQDHFIKDWVEGSKRTEKIFDATALLALDRAASAIDSLITPGTQQYQQLVPEDTRLLEDRPTMLYLAELTKTLFRMRYRPIANFAAQSHECYVSLMAFGTLGLFTDEILGVGTRYKSIALAELYIAENYAGIVDYVHREFPMSARAAYQKWGNLLPEKIKKVAQGLGQSQNPFQKFTFLHCVKPNEEMKRGARDYRAWPWTSYYVALEDRQLIEEGGYRVMPYAVSRHVTAPREVYGRSPAMMVLPDIKMVNEMEKTIIRAAHKIVDPPLLLYGDGILSAFSSRPNALNYGGVDEQGRQLVHPMKMGSNLPIALEMTEQKRKVINDAFYVTLFQILVQNPQMTATEALIRAQEKGQLLAPTIGRQNTEFLGPVTARELDIAYHAGVLPAMPARLQRAGGGIKIEHTSPLSRLRRAEDGVAIMRTLDVADRMAAAGRPEAYDFIDVDATIREIAEINGAPAKILRSVEMVAQIRTQRQQAQQQKDAMAGAAQVATIAKDGAKAGSLLDQTIPSTQVPAGATIQ